MLKYYAILAILKKQIAMHTIHSWRFGECTGGKGYKKCG